MNRICRGAALVLATVLLAACGGAAPATPAKAPQASASATATAQSPSSGATGSPGKSAALTPVTFQLDWLPTFGRESPYYVALGKGFYKNAGLNVKIIPGTGIVQAFEALDTGRAQFSFNDLSYMPISYEKSHVALEALAAIYAHAPQAIFYLSGGGIHSPSDLQGKSIAYSAGSSPYVLFPLFAQATHIDAGKVHWQQTTPQSLGPVLLKHKVQAMVTYILTQPALQAAAPKGVQVKAFMFGNYGIPILNNGLMTRRAWAQKHPKVVRAFVQATMKGMQFALANPAAAIAIQRKYEPQVNPKVGVAELKLVGQLIRTPETQKHCLGWIDPAQMKTTVQDVQKVFKLKGTFDVTKMFTNQYLACAS